MGTQRNIARIIRDSGVDDVLAVKENQPELHDAVKSVLDIALDTPHEGPKPEVATSFGKGHGRMEHRRYACLGADSIDWAEIGDKWVGLSSLIAAESRFTKDGKTKTERRYFISCLPPKVRPLANAIRGHWSVENGLHWVLDMTLHKDHSRVRMDHSTENLAVIRHFTVNMLNRDQNKSVSIRRKQKKAACEIEYRKQLLRN